MKSHFAVCFLLLLFYASTSAQVVDSIIVRTERSVSDSHPMMFSWMEVDSFSAGSKIGSSSWNWQNNNWKLGGRGHYDYDAQNRLSVINQYSYIQNQWVPFSTDTYTYNSNDSIVMITTDNRGYLSRSIRNFAGTLLVEKISEVFNNGNWERSDFKDYFYDINGNRILERQHVLRGLLWVPKDFIESVYDPGNQWYTDTSFTISTQKYYTEYQYHMRDMLGRDTAIYLHSYMPINPDPWAGGSRFINTYDWRGRFIVQRGQTSLGDFSSNYQSGTSYSYDSILHRTSFSDLTPDLYHNTGSIQYMANDTTPLVEINDTDGPGYSFTGYKEYFYFNASNNQVILPAQITKCSNDQIAMPIIYNPLNTFTNYSWIPDSGLSSDTVAVPIIDGTVSRTYSLFYTDINGVIDTAVIRVIIQATSFDSIVVTNIDTATTCQVVELTADPLNNNSYRWERNGVVLSGDQQLTVDTNGTVVLITTNNNGCTYRDSIDINYLVPGIRPVISARCPRTLSTTFSASLYRWYGYSYLDTDFASPIVLGTTTSDSIVLTANQNLSYTYYYVSCTDSNGCIRTSDRIFFRNEGAPVNNTFTHCAGGCDAELIIRYNDYYLNYPYTYRFQTGDSCVFNAVGEKFVLDSLCQGQLYFTVENGSGCILTDSAMVYPSNSTNFTTFSKTDVTSIDSCNGRIQITPVVFVPGNLIYACLDDTTCLYFASDSGYTFMNVCYGSHVLDIFDGSCSQRSNLFIDTLQCGISHTTVGTSCIGCNNGVVHLVPSGVPPFSISIDPAAGIIYNDSIAGLTSGIYTICITDSTGCNICFADTILEDPTSIQKTDFGDISIYPNPSNGKIVVVINSIFPEKEILISIISSTGKKIRSEKIVSGVNNLNYSDLANGIYFLQVEGSEDIVRRKIVLLK